MKMEQAIKLAHGREKLAKLLVVHPLTTYKWGDELPAKQVQLLRHMRPRWFKDEPKVEPPAPDVPPGPADEPYSDD